MISIHDGMTILDKGRLDIFVYEKYIGSLANISGDIVNSIGILPYRWYAKWDDEKPAKTGTLKIPSSVDFHPTDIKMGETLKIYPESDNKDYTVMSFFEKDKCWSNVIVQSMGSAMEFTESLFKGRLDTNIPYNLLVPYWETIGIQNGVDLGISGPAMEIVVRQVCRYKNDRSILYSQILEKRPEIGQVSYQFMNSRDLCAVSGVFSSISFEDMNAMIDNSINITSQKKTQEHSPIEDIIYL